MAQLSTDVELDEAWMKDALSSLKSVTDQDIAGFLQVLSDNWITTVQNVLDAIAGDTWTSITVMGMFKDLVKKKVVGQGSGGPGSGAGARELLSSFKPKTLELLTLEPNGEDFTMVGRHTQAEKLSNIFSRIGPKMKVAVISASRGMGKTVFLKKMCLSAHQPFAQARNCGRLIVLECQKGLELLTDKKFEKFWSRLIVFHLSHLFDSYWCETNQGMVQFRGLDLRDVVELTANESKSGAFEQWVFSVRSLSSAVAELVRLTKIAYKTDDSSVPVFALDNAHNFSKVHADSPSTTSKGKHNYLSRILVHLTNVSCPCVVAGTTDNDIQIIGDYSNFVAVHIFLTPIERKHWNLMGAESIEKHNKTNNTNVQWLPLHILEHGDLDAQASRDAAMTDADAAMTDATAAEDLGDSDKLDSTQGDYTEDDSVLADVQCHADDDNAALIGMIYHGAQVPRLMRIAFHCWHEGKWKGKSLASITEDFEAETKVYSDACGVIQQFKVDQFARLLLACSVYHKPVDDPVVGPHLLPGEFDVKLLMDKSIIFPYAVDRNENGNSQPDTCYVIPSVLFLCLNDNTNQDIQLRWKAVQEELDRLVPGLRWQHLFPSFTRWWRKSLNAYDAGRAWEDLVAASLAVRYFLHKYCSKGEDWCRFSDIYSLAPNAQASSVVSNVSVPQQRHSPSYSGSNIPQQACTCRYRQ